MTRSPEDRMHRALRAERLGPRLALTGAAIGILCSSWACLGDSLWFTATGPKTFLVISLLGVLLWGPLTLAGAFIAHWASREIISLVNKGVRLPCPRCGYPRPQGASSPRCPECGHVFVSKVASPASQSSRGSSP